MPTDQVECPGCTKLLKPTVDLKFRKHTNKLGLRCDFSQTHVPKEEKCSSSDATSKSASSVTPPEGDAPTHSATGANSGTGSCPTSSTEAAGATSSPPAPARGADDGESLPGVPEYLAKMTETVTEQRTSYRERVNSRFSQPAPRFSQPEQPEAEQPPLLRPTSFSQPVGRRSEAPAVEMTDLGKELTARLKEMFYAYDNRRTSDNRSAQATMGPSEMGTPCDRRLALSLMRMPAVNPGGDGWAAFVGTCIHAGLEGMFLWANAGTGRFAVEQRLEFDSRFVPKGTTDLIDRVLFMVDDHKCQGRWSRNKLKSTGPSTTYRVQAHVYAHGARKKGERVEHVAIFSWPRDESTLDDLYVWTEPYNPSIVKDAFERVEHIGTEVESRRAELVDTYPVTTEDSEALELEIGARIAADFNVADDCRFCPFYLPNAESIMDGCSGKR